jgi:hypothetical protein
LLLNPPLALLAHKPINESKRKHCKAKAENGERPSRSDI